MERATQPNTTDSLAFWHKQIYCSCSVCAVLHKHVAVRLFVRVKMFTTVQEELFTLKIYARAEKRCGWESFSAETHKPSQNSTSENIVHFIWHCMYTQTHGILFTDTLSTQTHSYSYKLQVPDTFFLTLRPSQEKATERPSSSSSSPRRGFFSLSDFGLRLFLWEQWRSIYDSGRRPSRFLRVSTRAGRTRPCSSRPSCRRWTTDKSVLSSREDALRRLPWWRIHSI